MKKKQLYKLVISIVAIVIGIYMTFFYKDDSEDTFVEQTNGTEEIEESEENEEITMQDNHDYSERKLPESDNNAENETYNEGYTSDIYFSNTEKLDSGKLPLEAQARLVDDADRLLKRSGYEDVTELYIDSDSYQETEQYIKFRCFMDGYEDQLEVQYSFDEKTLNYSLIINENSLRNQHE